MRFASVQSIDSRIGITMKNKMFLLASLIILHPLLSGFVLLGAKKATLDTQPGEIVQFVWDGVTPGISKKGEFQGGMFQDLSDEEFFLQLLTLAFEKWNEIPGSYLNMIVVQGGDAVVNSEDQINSLVVSKEDNATTAAFAKPIIDAEEPNTIRDCDIVIANRKTEARSLAYTVTHEIGHCLGLGHGHSNYNAIMGYSRASRSIKLGADDIAGLLYLYPDPDVIGSEPQEAISCSTLSAPTNNKFSVSSLLLLFIIFTLPILVPTFTRRKSAHFKLSSSK